MAKTKGKPKSKPRPDSFSGYRWVKATITGGRIVLDSRRDDVSIADRDERDEDVSRMTAYEIRSLVCEVLGIGREHMERIEVAHR